MELIGELDVMIASVHQRYKLDEDAMTTRLVTAMRQPFFKIWGHALGRLVLRRDPIDGADRRRARRDRRVAPRRSRSTAIRTGSISIRSTRGRPPRAGIPFVLSSDAHSIEGLECGALRGRDGAARADPPAPGAERASARRAGRVDPSRELIARRAAAVTEQYLAKKLLGAGAMGEVYLVENLAANRLEALKVMKKIDDDDQRRVAQARSSARFAPVIDSRTRTSCRHTTPAMLPDGRLYLTMEYVDGPSLSALLQARGPLPIAMTLGILAEVADSLHHAHLAGVIHRDLKPHNLMLADYPAGKIVKMLDFGLANILFGDLQESLVLSSDRRGVRNAAVHVARAVSGPPSDSRADIYAVGCIAFELLVGEPPFKGMIAPLFAAHIKKPPRVPSHVAPYAGIPKATDEIVMTCLQKQADLAVPERRRAVPRAPVGARLRPLRQPTRTCATGRPAS